MNEDHNFAIDHSLRTPAFGSCVPMTWAYLSNLGNINLLNPMRNHLRAAGLCLPFVFVSSAHAASCEAPAGRSAQTDVADCKLDAAPLMRCPLYADFRLADATLNKRYKILITKLKQAEAVSLRKTQRQWITFRENRCEEMQSAVKCHQINCVGVEHDVCVLELTEIRSKELAGFINDPGSAAARNFPYDSVYPGPFD